VTGDDLRRMQDDFVETSKKILLEQDQLRPVGFVVTLHKHVDKLLESGYGVEFIDPKDCLRDAKDDAVATLVVDLAMDWKKLYHAVLSVFPKTRDVLPRLLDVAETVGADDPHLRLMRPFMASTGLHEKDVVAATMRQICDKVDAFASIMHSEAWMRALDPSSETVDDVYKNAPGGLGQDKKSVEVLVSAMETHDLARMITVPICREPSADPSRRDGGRVLGFEEPTESVHTAEDRNKLEGRMVRFLKPLPEAS
jgi:hypothetical protein